MTWKKVLEKFPDTIFCTDRYREHDSIAVRDSIKRPEVQQHRRDGRKRVFHEEVAEEYVPIEVGDSFVECRVCGVKRSNLSRHINCKHNMTCEEYHEAYPDAEITSNSCRAHLKNAANTPEGRATRSRNLTNNLNKLWQDKEYVQRRREAGKRQMLKNMKDPNFDNARQVEYNGIKFRSRLEAEFAKAFDNHDISYEYEEVYLPYIDSEGISRTYVLDFYLPESNTVVEVKPSCFVEEIPEGKIEAANTSSYNYIILTEKDLDLQKILN